MEKDLADKISRIFRIDRVTYDLPSDTEEQECVFIKIDASRNTFRPKRMVGRMVGAVTIYSQANKTPFGFFSKSIEQAQAADKKDLFFTNFEENVRVFGNLVERSASFTFFFSGEYNPNVGKIKKIDIEIEET